MQKIRMFKVIEYMYDLFDSYRMSIEDVGAICEFIKANTDRALAEKAKKNEQLKTNIWKRTIRKSKKPTIRHMVGK